MGDSRRAAMAIDALRRGWPVTVQHLDNALTVLAVETAQDVSGAYAMLLSASRAATLKLTNQSAAADGDLPVLIKAPFDLDLRLALAVADPSLDLAYPMKGPFAALPLDDGPSATAAIVPARRCPPSACSRSHSAFRASPPARRSTRWCRSAAASAS